MYISIYILRNILDQLVSRAVIFCLVVFPVDPKQTHLGSIWHNNQMKLMTTSKRTLSEVFYLDAFRDNIQHISAD